MKRSGAHGDEHQMGGANKQQRKLKDARGDSNLQTSRPFGVSGEMVKRGIDAAGKSRPEVLSMPLVTTCFYTSGCMRLRSR